MEYNELLTLAINCLDGQKRNDGVPHSDLLYEFMRDEKGKQQFEAMYEDQQLLALYVVALLPPNSKKNDIDLDTFNFEDTILSLCLSPKKKDLLMYYMNGTMLLTDSIQNSDSKNDNIDIEKRFNEKFVAEKPKGKKKQQQEIKTKLLRLLICLLGPLDLVDLDKV